MIEASVCDTISRERDRGVLYCGVTADGPLSAIAVARRFGLKAEPGALREIDAATASGIGAFILGYDLAYHLVVIPSARAIQLVARFLGQFADGRPRYFTNAHFREDPRSGLIASIERWSPLTPGTFDTGIVVVASSLQGHGSLTARAPKRRTTPALRRLRRRCNRWGVSDSARGPEVPGADWSRP
jgi:hypothetical protein